MPFNHREDELRIRARDLISQGLLPCQAPVRLWGGRGTGQQPCSLCASVITHDEVEYELDLDVGARIQVTRFHFLCYAAWQLECARNENLRASSP
jgi:hypothetical protein